MNPLMKIEEMLKEFERKYRIPVMEGKQGDSTWRLLRLGVITASNAPKLVSKGQGRETYMSELIAQVATGLQKDVSAAQFEWGHEHEDAARSMYEFSLGEESHTKQVLFAFRDDTFRVGASPDGVRDDKRGVEIKCPYDTTNYISFATDGKIKSEYLWQVNMGMWILGCEQWDFVQYDPRVKKNPMSMVTLDADEKKIKTIEDAVPQFIEDMDKKLTMLGFEFGEQWERIMKGES